MPSSQPPASQTPLIALPAVSLDLETTGLDVRRDRVIQIGLVSLDGPAIQDRPRIDRLVDPEMLISEASVRITGIRDADVQGAPKIAAVLEELKAALQGRVVIGHHIAFDLAILRAEARRSGIEWAAPETLDVGHLLGALDPTLPDLGFDAVLSHFGVAVSGRHTAIGDSMAVAEVFGRLTERLRANDVRTLGEARSFAARRHDIVQGEIEAGWHTAASADDGPPSVVRIDSYVFSRALADVMSAPPKFITPEATLQEAASVMARERIGALLVGAPGEAPRGIITERDILSVFADRPGAAGGSRVADAMSAPVTTMSPDELLYRALAGMDRRGIRHVCVADIHGTAVGMVSQRDLLQHRARAESVVEDMVFAATDGPALALAFSRVGTVAEGLVAEGVDGRSVARVVSRELRSVTARAADIAAVRLAADGRGPAPAPWCLLVLGSGGRGESLLSADQDNALIHAGSAEDDSWFAAFGQAVADVLNDAGVPYCEGGVMAANETWRGAAAAWRDRIEDWLGRARPEDLLSVDIFFDLRPVAGDRRLGETLLADAVAAASESRPFLSLMAQSVAGNVPSFGFFGRPHLEAGRQDLKRDGLLPLVSFARAIGLRAGSTARATPDRIMDAARAGRLGDGDAGTLIDIHGRLLTLILQQQLRDIRDGIRTSSRVDLKALTRTERKSLKSDLGDLGSIVGDVQSLMS